jgi:hypothetical protein
MKAESSSVENNNDNPLLFDERIVKKSDVLDFFHTNALMTFLKAVNKNKKREINN